MSELKALRIQRRGLAVVWFSLIAGFMPAATATDTIQNAPWWEREIGDGVVVRHHHFDDLFNSQQEIWVCDADLSDPNTVVRFPYVPSGSSATVSTHAGNTPGAAVVINGNFANVSTNTSVQFFRVGGTVITTTQPAVQDDAGVAVAGDEAVTILSRPGSGWASLTQPNVMASNVVLIENDTLWAYPDIPFYQSDRHPRTLLGITDDNHLLMVVVDGRRPDAAGMSFLELQTLMQALGADDAINLDGGGSSTMWGRGEPGLGVMNVPSDGSQRSVVNAVAVLASPPVSVPAWDARFIGSSYENTMTAGETQVVWMDFQNYGTNAWDSNTHLGTTEPQDRVSPFHTPADWINSTRPSGADAGSVAPGATGRFTFTVTAPVVSATTTFTESFGLVQEGVTWMGPEQSRMEITVLPEGGLAGTVIVESRAGGQNVGWYSETGGWADSGTSNTALGVTPGIGMRYGSTYRSVAGLKTARWQPFLNEGTYNVYVTWGAGSNRRSPVTYFVQDSLGMAEYHVDQSADSDVWHWLGEHHFADGNGGYVEISNEDIDVSGSMYAQAAIFEPVPTIPVELAVFESD